jgi:hypothetical protein
VAIKTQEITSNFIGEYKIGDNLVFNACMLCSLIEANGQGAFNKLAVVQAGSIVEAALGQIIFRARNFNREGVKSISEEDRLKIEDENKSDKFYNIIEIMKDYKILDGLGDTIYNDLHNLRKYRNKVHIQAEFKIPDVSRDEDVAFSNEVCSWALELNARVLKHLSEKYARPKGMETYVKPIVIPDVSAA